MTQEKEFKREDITRLEVEDKIEHHLFGLGTVIVSEPICGVNRAVISFDDGRVMPIITHLAKIRMIKPKQK